MAKITGLSKTLIALIAVAAVGAAVYTRRDQLFGPAAKPPVAVAPPSAPVSPATPPSAFPSTARKPNGAIVAVSQWPGHMGLVLGNGGLTTQPGSAAAAEGLDLDVVFIEDAPSKNKALAEGQVDAIWSTVDELPVNLGYFRKQGVEARAFIQIDWSRGGDACVASKDVQTVEDVLGKKSATLLFSPDHTVFEFMITNSRLTPEQVTQVRKDTSFSVDDFTYARKLFAEKKIDVACLWEPDVTLALGSRPGAHRLFSTADATELVADVLVVRKDFLDNKPEIASKIAKVWFAGAAKGNADHVAAARFISTVVPRFRDELGFEQTRKAVEWARWTELGDNVTMFGLDGGRPGFDRIYNQADSIWINYPQAEIKDRFAPATIRDDRIVRKIWEEAGRQAAQRQEKYQTALAMTGTPIFTKPITINYRTADAQLDTESMAIINHQLLPQLEIARGMLIRVEGNTDAVGGEDHNQKLSERRARAIVDYLVSRGIDRARIVARGNGSSRPVASNKTVDGRAHNRRTDILFIPAARS